MNEIVVSSASELVRAIELRVGEIRINGTIAGVPSFTLPQGTVLSGGRLELKTKGVRLSTDNTLRDIEITTLDHEVAIHNDTTIPDAGTLRLEGVTTVGQVLLLAEDQLQAIHVEINGLHVKAADVSGRDTRPHGYGVDVLQGAVTLWNRQPDPSSRFTATVKGVRAGTEQTPVRGSGIFLAGQADREGRTTGGILHADRLETREIITDGGILVGTPDKISGGVFVVSGAVVDRVEVNGPVTTHGPTTWSWTCGARPRGGSSTRRSPPPATGPADSTCTTDPSPRRPSSRSPPPAMARSVSRSPSRWARSRFVAMCAPWVGKA